MVKFSYLFIYLFIYLLAMFYFSPLKQQKRIHTTDDRGKCLGLLHTGYTYTLKCLIRQLNEVCRKRDVNTINNESESS